MTLAARAQVHRLVVDAVRVRREHDLHVGGAAGASGFTPAGGAPAAAAGCGVGEGGAAEDLVGPGAGAGVDGAVGDRSGKDWVQCGGGPQSLEAEDERHSVGN